MLRPRREMYTPLLFHAPVVSADFPFLHFTRVFGKIPLAFTYAPFLFSQLFVEKNPTDPTVFKQQFGKIQNASDK